MKKLTEEKKKLHFSPGSFTYEVSWDQDFIVCFEKHVPILSTLASVPFCHFLKGV